MGANKVSGANDDDNEGRVLTHEFAGVVFSIQVVLEIGSADMGVGMTNLFRQMISVKI